MATLIPWLKFSGARNSDGTPVASGKAYFYEPGTTTPIAAYASADEHGQLTQPVALDAAGRAEVYVAEQAKIVITTADDAAVSSVDNATGIEAEHVNGSFDGAILLNEILDAIAALFDSDSYSILTDATATPSFEFDPDAKINVFSMSYAGSVTSVTITWPSPAPTIPVGRRYTLIFQFKTGCTPGGAVTVTWGANLTEEATTKLQTVWQAGITAPELWSADFIKTPNEIVQCTPWCRVDSESWSL